MKYKRKRRKGSNGKTKLTPSESLILSLIAGGFSDGDIAKHVLVSIRTVNRHIENIREKLDAKNRVHAVVKTLRLGLLSFDEIEKTAEEYAAKVVKATNVATNVTNAT